MHLRYLNNIQKYHTDEVNKIFFFNVSTINLIVMGWWIYIFLQISVSPSLLSLSFEFFSEWVATRFRNHARSEKEYIPWIHIDWFEVDSSCLNLKLLSFFLLFVTGGKRIYFFLLLPRTIESDLVSHRGGKNFKICQIPAPCLHSPPSHPVGFTLIGALDSEPR